MRLPYKPKFQMGIFLAKFFARYGRGKTLTGTLNDIFQYAAYGGIIAVYLKTFMDITLNPEWLIGIGLGGFVLNYAMGHLDEKWGFWKVQNSYQTRDLTPFWADLEKDIKDIKDKLNGKG